MTGITKNRLFSALALLGMVFMSSNGFATDYPLQEKLRQCEIAFEKMHNGDLTQEDAWKVRREHKKLVREILENLNKRNHSVLKSKDRTMSSEEILDNFVVMGSLLEMLATENLTMTDEWGYQLND